MDMLLSNTLTKKKEKFKPIVKGQVKMYSCGPTVYNYAHIGNLRAFIFADVLKRALILNGYKVTHVMNITDVGHLSDDADDGEDKMLKGARREGKTVWDVAKFYEKEFLKDMDALNILSPDKFTRATEHIKEMIDLNNRLVKNGFTYEAGGNLYYDTSTFKKYWELLGKPQDADEQQTRVKKDPNKRHPFDFVLWFTEHKHGKHAMEWESPWGKGFPGWHIECSAMSSKYLGENFDIHTGGIDHIPIHHTNEIAQSEGAFGKKWVNYWLHNEFLVIKDSEKMAKSSDNFIRLQTLIDKGFSPIDFRYFLLGTHYKKKVMFSFDALEAAKNAMLKLKNRVIDLKKEDDKFNKKDFDKYQKLLRENINDDLNTSRILANLWEFMQDEVVSANTKLKLIEEYDKILGLKLSETKTEKLPDEILSLQKKRDEARLKKDFKKSDEIRDVLLKKGYQVFDDKEKSEIRKA